MSPGSTFLILGLVLICLTDGSGLGFTSGVVIGGDNVSFNFNQPQTFLISSFTRSICLESLIKKNIFRLQKNTNWIQQTKYAKSLLKLTWSQSRDNESMGKMTFELYRKWRKLVSTIKPWTVQNAEIQTTHCLRTKRRAIVFCVKQ